MLTAYAIPTATWDAYEWQRVLHPDAILPLPGEPVVPAGHTPGNLKVWASNGTAHGWYHYQTDTFEPAVG